MDEKQKKSVQTEEQLEKLFTIDGGFGFNDNDKQKLENSLVVWKMLTQLNISVKCQFENKSLYSSSASNENNKRAQHRKTSKSMYFLMS